MRANVKKIFVEMFKCGACDRLHQERERAETCCACTKCKTPFLPGKQKGFRMSECGYCMYGTWTGTARKNVTECRDRLASAERHLAKILADGRPPKGTPV